MIKYSILLIFIFSSFYIFGQNLITNPSCELDPTTNGWTQVDGNWVRGSEVTAQTGSYHFFAGAAADTVEIYQDVDVSSNATNIDAGVYKFTFSCWLRDYNGNDEAKVLVEYRNASSTVLATYNTGFQGTTTWTQYTDIRTAPTNTRTIRIRLQSKRNNGTDNDGYIDNLSLTGSKDIGIYGPGGVGKVDGTSSLVLWLDANTVSATNGSTVTSWNDQSGNSFNLTSGNGATFNTNVQNGYPAFSFDGSSDYFERAYEADLNPSEFTVFASDNVTSSGSYKALISNRDDPAGTEACGFILYATPTDNYWQFWNGSVASSWEITNSATSTAGNWAGQTMEYQSGTNAKKIYVNGDMKSQNTHTLNKNTVRPIRVGAGANETSPSFYFNGDISEVIMYDEVINDAQRIIIQNYLAAKYNYTLTANDIYTMDNSANGDYDHEIAGIGRVDNSNYHNDAQGTGIVRILNPTNLDDDEFLIWGHNDGTQTLNSKIDLPTGVKIRFEREWRVSEVDVSSSAVDVGSIDIRWDLSGQTNIITADLRLLIDTDNDGDFSDETPISGATSLGSDIYAFTGVTGITDGLRFTLGSVTEVGPGGVITDNVLWIKANENVTQSSNSVSTWGDNSGGGNNATQTTAAQQPTYTATGRNYNPTITFDGDDDNMSMNDVVTSANTSMSIYAVGTNETGGDTWHTMIFGQSATSWTSGGYGITALNSGSTDFGYWVDDYSANVVSTAWIDNPEAILEGKYDGSDVEFFINADSKGTDNYTGTVGDGGSTYIGGGTSTSYNHKGDISEVLIYDSDLSSADRAKVNSYLAIKYGITLDIIGNPNYVNSNGTTIFTDAGTYWNNIIGISRDDKSEFYQKQSKQYDDTTRIYLSTLVSDNSSNTGTMSSDMQSVVIGNNTGGLLLESSTELPNGVYSRLGREWKVTNTSFDGTFSIDIELKSGSPTASNLRLLVDADGDFTNATVYSPTITFSGGIATISGISTTNIPINSTRYITLASNDRSSISTDPTYFEYISNVQIGSINNTTTGSDADGDGNTGYDDFTTQTAVLLPGSTYSLSVTLRADATDYVKAWIDWNDDGDYIDAGEEYTVVSNTSSNGPHSVSVTVPASATGNNITFRVSLKYSSAPTSTETVTYGEVEEYSLYIDKDTDGDGVYDSNDKDADNDGMLDEDENFCLSQDFLNGNFENNLVTPSTYVITDASNIPGWNTTASDNKIEIWHDGFNSVPAYEGTYFAEINANNVLPQRLYQTLDVDPGDIVKWNVAHRGRSGIDTMAIKVGPVGSPTTQQLAATDKTSWQVYSSSYTVPAGVTQIEMGFEAIYTASGNSSVGNFIDDVQLYITKTTYCDSDGDGTPNIFDLDSDNDGIADVIEAGGTDPDNDGRIGTGAITDTDGDGLSDIVDTDNGGTALSEPNSDADALKNYMDIDSDHDGIVDNIEGQTTDSYTAPSGTDANNNGWDDAYDGNAGGTAIVLTDTDGDGTPDYMDTNSDDDGEPDSVEAYDTDKSGTTNTPPTNNDADGDGLDNAYDVDGTSTTDNGGSTNNNQTANSFPNDDNSTTSERDWRDILSTLPVSLISFEAKLIDDYVELNWATATEINNDYFIVQRSIDNKIFEEISRVEGNGNSNIIIEYNSYDMDPLEGIIYYRLKQVDYDGTTDYSNVVAIRNNPEIIVEIYPNPSNGIMNISVKEAIEISIFSALGKEIYHNQFEANSVNQIDISDNPKGVYIISYKTQYNIESRKIILR